jgi:hypothetical protein
METGMGIGSFEGAGREPQVNRNREGAPPGWL